MLEDQGEELRARQGAIGEALALGIAAAEGHLAGLASNDVLLLDDAAIESAGSRWLAPVWRADARSIAGSYGADNGGRRDGHRTAG